MSETISPPTDDFVISRSTKNDVYGLWRFDPNGRELLTALPLSPNAACDRRDSVVPIGPYLLAWGPVQDARSSDPYFDFRLFAFDPTSDDPLAATPLQKGQWPKKKFWGRGADFGNPTGGHKQFDQDAALLLIPLGSYLLNFVPTDGRGTFGLWNFDPCPIAPGTADPVVPFGSAAAGQEHHSYQPYGSFRTIQLGDELIPMNGYVLARNVGTGAYALWSFDPQADIPLAHPAVQQGTWASIDRDHRLVPIGGFVLDWVPGDRSYRLWWFDPKRQDPLCGPLRAGHLPEAFTGDSTLLGVQTRVAVDSARAAQPGTVDFMRSKIKHVVYYMLENRSFDHVLGWLYEHGEAGIHLIGPAGLFKGASTEYYNRDGDKRVHLSKYKDGKLSIDYPLEMFNFDPYHDNSDVLRQLFFDNPNGYEQRLVPDMGGFVWNNGTGEVMQTYTPEQLPVLNGLAKHFAVSDEWFSSMPSATDVNRGFALTGSAMMELNNFMSPPQYQYWPEQPHRGSIWKVLWANGFTDWKIYHSTVWYDYVFTYQLFLEGQIPTVDAHPGDYVADIAQFLDDAKAGNLPAFSYLEPYWIAPSGTTSYHPGEDVVPAERQLNAIYNALREGPDWEQTLLVITFDEHGGIYDHVPPPHAENPWPNDVHDGFRCDLMGVRVPTILVSPWIEEKTVFRSETGVAYDATSILATLLKWYGIPKSRWFLGERTNHAPTFEGVISRSSPRAGSPAFQPPYDQQYPPDAAPTPSVLVHDLHRRLAHGIICTMARGKLAPAEITRLSSEVLDQAHDLPTLTRQLDNLQRRFGSAPAPVSHGPAQGSTAEVDYVLGSVEAIRELYPPAKFATNPIRYDGKPVVLDDELDVIRHYTENSLAADGFNGFQVAVREEDGLFKVRIGAGGPVDRLRAFADRHTLVLSPAAAGKAATGMRLLKELGVWNPMAGFRVNESASDGECKWHLFPPLGLNLIGQRGLLLLHYPPWQVIEQGTFLGAMTMNRWNTVLEAAGVPKEQVSFFRTFVDVNPVAAPGSGQSEYPNDYFPIMMASAFFDGPGDRDYIRSMLELYLAPPGGGGQHYTLPLLVCGSPLYDPQAPGWFRTRYKEHLPTRDGIPQMEVLQTGSFRVRPDSGRATPYLGANHMIAAGVTGRCTNDPSKIPDIRKYEAQDLVAASFLYAYAQDPDLDPREAKRRACQRWFGNDDGSGAPQPPDPKDAQVICALAQMDLFFCPTPRPHPKYGFDEAMQRCAQAANGCDPCCAPIWP